MVHDGGMDVLQGRSGGLLRARGAIAVIALLVRAGAGAGIGTGCAGPSFTVLGGSDGGADGGGDAASSGDAASGDSRPRDGSRADGGARRGDGGRSDASRSDSHRGDSSNGDSTAPDADDAQTHADARRTDAGRDGGGRDGGGRDGAGNDAGGSDASPGDTGVDSPSTCGGGEQPCQEGACPEAGACAMAMCLDGCCQAVPESAGMACGDAGVCDGHGACVGCNGPADCPSTGASCVEATCEGHVCGQQPAPPGTDCTDHGGTFCNGSGKCVQCTASENPCSSPTPFCSAAGQCVQCTMKSQCSAVDSCKNGVCTFL
jgi:hypothetical protein